MLMQFGQFVDHDLSFTPEVNLDLEAGCCEDPAASPECFPITVPQPDPDFSAAETCKDLVRSAPHCSSGSVRQQFNAITAHLDGSQVYNEDKIHNNDNGDDGRCTAARTASSPSSVVTRAGSCGWPARGATTTRPQVTLTPCILCPGEM